MKLDYLHGRTVTGVIQSDTDDWDWALQLDGGAVVRNLDKRRTAAPSPEVVGMTFFDSSCDDEANAAVVKVGRITIVDGQPTLAVIVEVDLTNTLYSIAAPGVDEEQPGATTEEADPLPPDPSPERVADGPDVQPPDEPPSEASGRSRGSQ